MNYYKHIKHGQELSPAEIGIHALVLRGMSNNEIAAIKCISPKTVKGHLTFIFRKLGVKNRCELIMLEWNRKTTAKRVVEAPVYIPPGETYLPKGKRA